MSDNSKKVREVTQIIESSDDDLIMLPTLRYTKENRSINIKYKYLINNLIFFLTWHRNNSVTQFHMHWKLIDSVIFVQQV